MSCNCKRAVEKEQEDKRAKALIAGTVKTVSLEVLTERRNICRSCPHSTKNTDPAFAKFSGLTSGSRCLKSGRMLLECLKDPKYACPDGRFPAA